MAVTPMFPLGGVLVPGMLLPLQVFEPRYLRMLDDCRDGDRDFGVVLIERGSEVGGGDVRVDVGTVARILRAEQLPGGRWGLVVIGTERIRVERWLPDDPYPQAETTRWPDEPGETPPSPSRTTVVALLRRASALSRELGLPAAPLDLELSDDPLTAGYQATALAPVGPADRQRLLAAPTVAERWTLLESLLHEQIELLEAQLTLGR